MMITLTPRQLVILLKRAWKSGYSFQAEKLGLEDDEHPATKYSERAVAEHQRSMENDAS